LSFLCISLSQRRLNSSAAGFGAMTWRRPFAEQRRLQIEQMLKDDAFD
jgi:hypothetical protein